MHFKKIVLAFAALALAGVASAQPFPNKPIRLVVPFPPGGPTDIVARPLAQLLGDALKQPVVIENKGGAGGSIAADSVAKSPPDGYTLIMATVGTHAINAALYRKAKYDPVKDFEPVIQVVATALVLTVNVATPFKSVQDLVAYAKGNPGKLSYGSGGSGATGHLAMELLKSVTGTDIVHVPYKGTGPVMTDLIGGQIQMTIGSAAPTIPQVKAGKLRALAVTSKTRSAVLPDVPTIAESGFPAYEVTQWFGILAPAGTPKAVITRLNQAMQQALNRKEMQSRYLASSAEPVGGSPEVLRTVIAQEVAKWPKLVRALDLKAD